MPSPNHDARGDAAIDMLVLHYTGMKSAKEALERLCDPAAKVSAHYTIDEDGTVFPWSPDFPRALFLCPRSPGHLTGALYAGGA